MRKLMAITFCVTLSVVCGGVVLAADAGRVEAFFKKMDKDGDGKLTLEELKAGKDAEKAGRADKMLKRADKDGNGSLSLEELKTARAGKKKAK